MTSGNLWNFYEKEMKDDANESNNDDYRVNNEKTTASKSFEFKTKIIGNTPINNNTLNTVVFH